MLTASFALVVPYFLLSIGVFGVYGDALDIICAITIVCALIFSCCRVCAVLRPGSEGAFLSAALGLFIFAFNELNVIAYLYLLRGDPENITLTLFSRNCAYLFFISAALILLGDIHKAVKTGAGVLSAAAVVLIFAGIIADSAAVTYYPALLVLSLCAICSVCLLIKGCRHEKFFAAVLLSVCLLDMLGRLTVIYLPGRHWHALVMSLYPAVYLLFGSVMLDLKERGEQANHE